MTSPRIAIIGGGPIGVEAAALLESKGMGATLFERSTLGASLGRWSHVSFFSTWALNRSSWGAARVATEVDLNAFRLAASLFGNTFAPSRIRWNRRTSLRALKFSASHDATHSRTSTSTSQNAVRAPSFFMY